MTHSYVWHATFICVPWLIHMCAMTHSYVWHDSFICVTGIIRMCVVISTGKHEWVMSLSSSTFMLEITHMNYYYSGKIEIKVELDREMTHSYVWWNSFTCVIWFIYLFFPLSCLGNNSLICVTGINHCTKSFFSLYIVIFLLTVIFIFVTWLTHMCDGNPSYVW